MARRIPLALSLVVAALAIPNAGCIVQGGISGVLNQKRMEDKFWNHERYERVPVLGPITSGGPPAALDPPSDDEVMRALESVRPVQGGVSFLWERQRLNVRIVKDLIADYVDPVRFYPLVGPAQQHHAHYKCTIYFSERTYVGWPVPHMLEDEDSVEVIYIDHNHLHMVGDVDGGVRSNYERLE